MELTLPMALRQEAMPDDPTLRAFMIGPLVLAGGLGNEGITDEMVMGRGGADMKKHPGPAIPELAPGALQPAGKPLTFRASQITFAPLHRTAGQRYSIYWRMSQTSES